MPRCRDNDEHGVRPCRHRTLRRHLHWALAVALPIGRIEETIGDVVLPEDEGSANEPLAREA
jgi:hypothetical protein